ncbi:MAG: FG-GAP repeat protein [Planctomycetes bacterium]|nr:FG-GAP repeat protein [Planctomycetota bacterium]
MVSTLLLFVIAALQSAGPGAELQLTERALPAALKGFIHGPAADMGDIDGDGTADFVQAMPDSEFGEVQFGRVVLVSGLTRRPLLAVRSHQAVDQFGTSVANAGDLDADGLDDFIVGAPQAFVTGTGGLAGRATVYSSKGGRKIWSVLGTAGGDLLGQTVASIGDIDQDGIPDVAIAAVGSSLGRDHAGAVRIVSGRTGIEILTIPGAAAGGKFGYSICAVGDVDGDGVPEFAAGAPFAGGLAEGAVQIVSLTDPSGGLAIAGDSAIANFGFSLAALAPDKTDSSGGGARIAVGAPQESNRAGDPAGAVHLLNISHSGGGFASATMRIYFGDQLFEYFGATLAAGPFADPLQTAIAVGSPRFSTRSAEGAGRVRIYSTGGSRVLLEVAGTQMEEQYSHSLAALRGKGGYSNLLINAPGFGTELQTLVGRTSCVAGNGKIMFQIAGAAGGQQRGYAMAAAGDWNRDGIVDVAVSSPTADSATLNFAGTVEIVSGADGAVLRSINGNNNYGYFGQAVESVGDLDGDGIPEIAIGEPFFTDGRQPVGAVHIYSSTGRMLADWIGTEGAADFGWTIRSIADLDGDGFSDVAVAAPLGGLQQNVPARVYCISSKTGRQLFSIAGTTTAGGFGTSLAFAAPDRLHTKGVLWAGEPSAIVNSAPAGAALAFDLDSRAAVATLAGQNANDAFGFSLILTNSGPEPSQSIIVGAPNTQGGVGTVYAFGADGARRWSLDGTSPFGNFGFAIASLTTAGAPALVAIGAPFSDDVEGPPTNGFDDNKPGAGSVTLVDADAGLELQTQYSIQGCSALGYSFAAFGTPGQVRLVSSAPITDAVGALYFYNLTIK